MNMKRLEGFAKVVLAAFVAMLCWRRARPVPTVRGARVLLVRIDHRVGEILLTTPLVEALHAAGATVSALVHPKMVRVLHGLPGLDQLFAADGTATRWRGPFAPTLRAIRRERFDVILNCGNWAAPAVTSAILARLAGPAACVIGPANLPSRWLADVPVAPLQAEPNELRQRLHLVTPLTSAPLARMRFRQPHSDPSLNAFIESHGRYVVVNPGSRLAERRAAATGFVQICTEVTAAGLRPVVTWGPGEEPLRDAVCRACPAAVAAPATSLDGLAELMRRAQAVVCNNTGPMHLAVAIGTPTLAFFTAIDMARWGHHHRPHQMVDLTHASPDTMKLAARQFLRDL